MDRPTGRDVARLAGVSQATVSLVFSGSDTARARVSSATRDRVREAARQLGYQPQAAGRQLRLGRTGLVHLAVPNILGPFFARVLDGAQSAATELGLAVVFSSGWDGDALARACNSRQFDGLLLCSPDDSQLGELPASTPVVFLDADPALVAGSPLRRTLELDVSGGMASAVSHLRELGHRRIGHLRSTDSAYTFRSRQAGFEQAARSLEVLEVGVSINGGLEAARAAAHRLLADVPPQAVVCDDDVVAAGLYHAAADLGLRIPDDLSVVGIDNILAASLLAPALTTVDLPGEHLGSAGVGLLAELVAGRTPSAPAPLPTTLLVRGSTRAADSL
ncbi:LacI family repressor for deo operon, udp, cdd, tsx, nupC, and nupG [Streptacidiphilus sp. MAP12-16]|uniref:LacI family DNA-binding transcriptional regulator n=1 Tax=Streptacidiphilus sp. MAP12-16 TaxID=3156300 RepID=UPI0035173F20